MRTDLLSLRHVLLLGLTVLMFCGAVRSRPARAHEGHAPLPTKGVLVDVTAGRLILTPDAHKALAVKTAEATYRPHRDRLLTYATLETPWQQHAFVTTQVEGRIEELNVRPGQRVRAGEVLGRVQSTTLETLQLDLLNAENERRLTEKMLVESEPLATKGVIATQQVIEQRARHRENENAVRVARSKLLGLGLSNDDIVALTREGRNALITSLPITASIAGTVIHADVSLGQVIRPDQHLFEIVDYSKVWVRIDVLERDLPRITRGQAVELTLSAYPLEVIRGTITATASALDATTHLGSVWAELINPSESEPRFLPGMRGQARVLLVEEGNHLSIPTEAVLGDGPERFVLVEESATARAFEYRRVAVSIAGRSGDVMFLAGGDVFPGDRVVTTGGHELASSFVQGVLRLTPEAAHNIDLQVEPVAQNVIEQTLEIDGQMELPPDGRAFSAAGVTGTLQALHVDRGEAVKAGQVIAEVTSLEFQNLQLELLSARLEEELSQDTAERLRPLGGQAVAARRLWEAEAAEQAARNRREAATRTLHTLGLTASDIDSLLSTRVPRPMLPVRAAIDGVVVNFAAVLGQAIAADESLIEIHDLSHVWVRGFLSERDLAAVRMNQKARVRLVAFPETVLQGSVVRSGRVLGLEDRTLSVWVEFDAPLELPLRHNMLTRLTLVVGSSEPVLAIPPESIVHEGTRRYVFVHQHNGTFERRLVETGRNSDRFIEIVNGLHEGELVAVRGATGLQTVFAAVR